MSKRELGGNQQGKAAIAPLALPRRIRRGIRKQSGARSAHLPDDVKHLWIYLCDMDCPDPAPPPKGAEALTEEEWLNVIDEAAALGAESVVFSLGSDFDAHPFVWRLARWAQESHGMAAGFHFDLPSLDPRQRQTLLELDPAATKLYVLREHLDAYRSYAEAGIDVCVANLTPEEADRMHCTLPCQMLFINRCGMMYTCGFVKGNSDYLMGHIFKGRFQRIVRDPKLPHAVPESAPHIADGCDGCPPLVDLVAKGGQGCSG